MRLPGIAVMFCVAGMLAAQDSRERLLEDANTAYRSLHASQAVDLYRRYLALYPDRADVRVYLGGALLNLQQWQPALNEAQRAIQIDRRYSKGYILAGRVYAAREQWYEAQDYFGKALALNRNDPDALYFSGRAYYDANQFERATQAFEHALRIDSTQGRIYENLALAQDGLGRYGAAEESFRKAVELARGAWRPFLAYGAFLFRQARPAESLPMLRRAFAIAPAELDVRFELARVLYHENSLAEALRILQPALASGECRVHNLMARIYSAAGQDGPAGQEIQAMEHCKSPGEQR